MPLLRKISKAKWYDSPELPTGAIQGDALTDLRSESNSLSVWSVKPDLSNLESVVAALASNRATKIDKLDYVLIDEAELSRLDIEVKQSPGDSPHAEANEEWHFDLVRLSVDKIVGLAAVVKASGAEHRRVPAPKVKAILATALTDGRLQKAALTPDLVAGLEP